MEIVWKSISFCFLNLFGFVTSYFIFYLVENGKYDLDSDRILSESVALTFASWTWSLLLHVVFRREDSFMEILLLAYQLWLSFGRHPFVRLQKLQAKRRLLR